MIVRKCDICKKKIAGKPITAGFDFFTRHEFCVKCGQPIINFLKANKLIKKDDLKQFLKINQGV